MVPLRSSRTDSWVICVTLMSAIHSPYLPTTIPARRAATEAQLSERQSASSS